MSYEQLKIQRVLKKLMKQKGMTYQGLSEVLGVSEATIKRRLNGPDLSINEINDFATVFSLSFYELLELSKLEQREAHEFTPDQETLLASAAQVMGLFRAVLAGRSFVECKDQLHLSELDLRRYCRQLEDVGLVQLLPGDRIVPLVKFPFRWRKNGVLATTYQEFILKNIFQRISQKGKSAGLYSPFEFALSPESYTRFCHEIDEVQKKYRILSEAHLDKRIEWNHLVSGLFFIDQFSVWDTNQGHK